MPTDTPRSSTRTRRAIASTGLLKPYYEAAGRDIGGDAGADSHQRRDPRRVGQPDDGRPERDQLASAAIEASYLAGVRLEAKVHIVTGAVSSAQNIVKCANRTGLNVSDIVLQPLASAEAVP